MVEELHKNVIHTYNEKEIKVLTDGLNVEMKCCSSVEGPSVHGFLGSSGEMITPEVIITGSTSGKIKNPIKKVIEFAYIIKKN